MSICSIYSQEAFLGANKKKNYFEGWYYKLINRQRDTVMAVIPGITIGKSREDAHAFIQVIDAVHHKTQYHRFPLESFCADRKKLSIQIGKNEFTETGIKLDLWKEGSSISGELRFADIVRYPKTVLSPGIMGPFSFIPGMECYHGIVHISHTIRGALDIDGTHSDFTGGEGYLEKDWGKSFPERWIWIQANHFSNPGDSFMFSIARIPWLGRSFTGLIAFVHTGDKFYKFATYNGGKASVSLCGNKLQASLTKPGYVLNLKAVNAVGGTLKAPKNGLMHRDITESITAEVTVELRGRRGELLFLGSSERAGMEVVDWPGSTV